MNTQTFDSQFSATLLLMSRALRGGYSVKQCFEIISKHAPQPTAGLFASATPSAEGLQALVTEMPSSGLQQMVTIMLRQRETGGNLADMIDQLLLTLYGEPKDMGWASAVDLQDGYDFETHKPRKA